MPYDNFNDSEDTKRPSLKVKKSVGKKKSKVFKAVNTIVRSIYKVGLCVENAVSHANKKGIAKLCEYIRALSILIYKKVRKALRSVLRFLVRHSRYAVLAASIALVAGLFFAFSLYSVAVKVSFNDEIVGYLNNEGEFVSIKETVEQEITEQTGDTFKFNSVPVFSFSIIKRDDLSNKEEVYTNLYEDAEEALGKSYGIFIDGVLIGTNPKENEILNMLDDIKKIYSTPGAINEKISFVRDVQIIKDMYPESASKSIEELKALFTTSSNVQHYVIQKGDTASKIAKMFGVSLTQLSELNPGINLNKIFIGDTITISKPILDLGIKIEKTVTYTELIPYDTKKIPSADLYEDTSKVKVKGVEGEKEITASIVSINGVEQEKEVISSKVVKKPITAELYVGTKKVSPSGYFIWPVASRSITDYFGYRVHPFTKTRKFHNAIDISASKGSDIKASDGGVVTKVQKDGIYGLWVEIKHNSGVYTRYAHCSKIYVKEGQKVHQGQVIAAVGSTGQSTGPHLHFEIIINGDYVNPLKYLKK